MLPFAGAETRHNISLVNGLYRKGFMPTIVTGPRDVYYPKDESLDGFLPEKIKIERFTWPFETPYGGNTLIKYGSC